MKSYREWWRLQRFIGAAGVCVPITILPPCPWIPLWILLWIPPVSTLSTWGEEQERPEADPDSERPPFAWRPLQMLLGGNEVGMALQENPPSVVEEGRIDFVSFLLRWEDLSFLLILSTLLSASVGAAMCKNRAEDVSLIPAFTSFLFLPLEHYFTHHRGVKL